MKVEKGHVVLLPSPGIGHLTPLAELAKKLVLYHGLTATIITFSDLCSNVQESLLSSLPQGISYISLPHVPLDDLPTDAHIVTRLSHMIARSVPSLHRILLSLQKYNIRIIAYIIDLFGGDTLTVAAEFGIPQYIFFTSNFFYLSFLLNIPTLYEGLADSTDNVLHLPGCVPLHAKDFSTSSTDKNSVVFAWMVRHAKHHDKVDGIMVNSFGAIEGATIKFLQTREYGKPAIFPVGPLTSDGYMLESQRDHKYMCWLDRQPIRSVLFISFGSGGTLSFEQTREMAFGLEMSKQRFLWVLREPDYVDASADYFSTLRENNNPFWFLPQGFVDRTKGRGMVVSSWASQAKILAHGATGGFLSHCGWNSTLESIVNGVPMIAWPLYSEQRMNAVMLCEALKVALRPKSKNEVVVMRREIAKVVKNLMEGEGGKEVRKRMQELKVAAMKEVEDDGDSRKALIHLVEIWNSSS